MQEHTGDRWDPFGSHLASHRAKEEQHPGDPSTLILMGLQGHVAFG